MKIPPAKKPRPRIAVISLSWNARDDLRSALKCVEQQTWKPKKVIVVDSGSTDGTGEMIRKDFSSVKFYPLEKNMGYAAGYNVAFSLVPDEIDYVIVLDQDVTMDRNYIKNVVTRFEKEPPTTAVLMCDLDEPRMRTLALEEGYIKAYHGSCFSYRNKFKKLMKYDEKMFAYYNEADLCARLLNRGLKILFYPKCKTVHKKDSMIMNPFRTYLMTRNGLWFWWKNTRFADALIATAVSLAAYYNKASRYKSLPAYFRAVVDAFAGLPYCIRTREVCRHISYKDLDDVRKFSDVLDAVHMKPFFKPFDYIYERTR